MFKISESNSKLGKIASFSLPAGEACPGKTEECHACYAAKVERIYKNAAKAYQHNLNELEIGNFVEDLTSEITKITGKKKANKVFRWHVSGDWATIKYMYDAIKVMSNFPEVQFYSYTRNWRLVNWIPHLETLKNLPNMTLIASIDDATINNNEWPPNTWRIAYFGVNLAEVKSKYNMIQCPNQTVGILCDQCKLCFSQKVKNNLHINIVFKKH